MTQGIEEQELLRRLRMGEDEAFSELFEAHAPAVRRLARSLSADRGEVEDITAETFFRVLRAVKRGNGPNDNVRGYLLTVARRVAWEWKGNAHDVPVTDDELTSRAGVAEFNASRVAERSLITRAFTSLPERWRTVLWQTEVEGAQPAVVAPKFGLSPNATAALARRARQGLRAAYLQAHLTSNCDDGGCRSVRDKLGGYTAGSLTGSEARRISAHLGNCPRCRSTHDELQDVCHSLRAHSGVVAVAASAAAGGGTSAGPGFAGALKSAFTGAKVKIGAAVASTAAVGALGFTAGPALSESAVEILGLHGEQGVSETTVERSTGKSPEPTNGAGPRSTTGPTGTTWGLDDERDGKAAEETSEPSEPDVEQVSSKEKGARTPEAAADEVPGSVAEPANPRNDGRGARADVDPRTDSNAVKPSSNRPSGNKPTTKPSENRPTTKPSGGASSRPSTTNEQQPPAQDSGDGGASTASSEPCQDEYYYDETYNEKEQRTEIYEYSYQDGHGYERIEHYYDNGDYWMYEKTWYDNC